ncbi:hypothetical protein N7462_009244 [Penicillium macrosclerotiorum]|uniref:uncharacterized protein n=1 Tax=Penicillium macrosclerotiorum TaxID=303699 RepID=UPI002547EA98|nr:uncharacterized protein N7462_009244 [Penicillium macrosclerotiorum]KAJ5673805.1 hypothetical protein N7462_009244 [Penicillium macrosclerotiorum]
MGRQAYLNRLALGRSPYEPPETAAVDPSSPVRRVSNIHSDSYMQQYDARGHPVNPESKTLGRELRRAKNDILSTMGIVVSGEDRNSSSPNEQQKLNQIATENDFGLVITTADQLASFFTTWFSSSLAGRIQTFKHYTHAALLDVIRSERGATGVFGFYLAGIPAWVVTSGLSIARDSPLKRLFATVGDLIDLTGNNHLSLGIRSLFVIAYSTLRSSILLLSIETYMYSLLQSLAIIPSNSVPSLNLMIPFREQSLIRLPSFPTDFSVPSIGGFLVGLLTSPGVLTFLFAFYLRPNLEERIYRLIRRQLPKPMIADELSIRVAYDENLVDWVVPTLGRRAEEETRRAKLSLLDDIKCELASFRGWVFSFFNLFSKQNLASNTKLNPNPRAIDTLNQERIENLRNSIESLQHQLEEVQLRNNHFSGVLAHSHFGTADSGSPAAAQMSEITEEDLDLGINQVLTNENRMSQSPGEMSNDFFSEMATLGRTSAQSTESSSQSLPNNTNSGSAAMDRHNSRSNTLFSHPSSPESSPPTSPRVRASLIHQSSDIITMQLELLGNRTRNPPTDASVRNSQIPRFGHGNQGLRPSSTTMDRRSIAEFLESLIMNQAQHQAIHQTRRTDIDDISNISPTASSTTQDMPVSETSARNSGQDVPGSASVPPNPVLDNILTDESRVSTAIETTAASTAHTLLPDGVEEPSDEESDNQIPVAVGALQISDTQTDLTDQPISSSRLQGLSLVNNPSGAHRITLLSAHPVDSLASHLAAFISAIILSPSKLSAFAH